MFTKNDRPPFAIAQDIDANITLCNLYSDSIKGKNVPFLLRVMILRYYIERKWNIFRLRGELRHAIRDQSLARTANDRWM